MKKIKVLIVIADFYKDISNNLLDGAINFFNSNKIDFDVVRVPGALEISQTIKFYHESDINYDGYLALGCVIKGETYHFELVSNESASSLSKLSIQFSIPIGNGILTCNADSVLWQGECIKCSGPGAELKVISYNK